MIDAKKLAKALREAVRCGEDWRDALTEVAVQIEDGEPAKQFWVGPFAWAGGECPLPPETLVLAEHAISEQIEARKLRWSHTGGPADITSFSYRADNPEGWIPRPEGWVPPDETLPAEMRDRYGNVSRWTKPTALYGLSLDDHGITHIRLLPRRAATPEPTPIPADVRDVVREALERSLETLRVSPMTMDARCKIKEALDALDASPAEKVVGFAIIDPRSPTIYSQRFESADEARRHPECAPGRRVVRLVAEPEEQPDA